MTGCEALYADLGHFGKGPIQTAWLSVALLRSPSIISAKVRCCWPHRKRSKTLFPALPGVGAASHGGTRHRRHGDRQPSGHHRRLLAHQPGRAARSPAAAAHPAHLRDPGRPDLHSARQRHAPGRCALPCGAVPIVKRACLRLWHRRQRHHGGDGDDGLRGDLEGVEVADVGRGGADRAPSFSSIPPSSPPTCSKCSTAAGCRF